MHPTLSFASARTGCPAWAVARRSARAHDRRHRIAIRLAVVLLAAAIGALVICHYLSSWIWLPLL